MNIPKQGYSATSEGLFIDGVKHEHATVVFANGQWHITVYTSVNKYGHGATPEDALQSWMNNNHWKGFDKPTVINKDESK